MALALVCSGCGAAVPPSEARPFRCAHARAGDDIDHVIERAPGDAVWRVIDSPQPFVRYRDMLLFGARAAALGLDGADYAARVARLDDRVAAVEGHGFVVTPYARAGALSERLGVGVWVKDETGNVSGSHKGRHLFGLLLWLALDGETAATGARLAIASCGNAALAAAVIARAGERPLDVYVPPSASPSVLARLAALGATIHSCARAPGVVGDPCYHAFRAAVDGGALPFACQGPDNGLTIEGGRTLGCELVEQSVAAGRPLDRVFVQVGGGALASAVAQALSDAHRAGALPSLPRLHAVQTRGGHPLTRAYDRLLARILERLGSPSLSGDRARADLVRERFRDPAVREELARAARHKSELMWPWESEPHSAAHGILDDETYDWRAIVTAMLASGGWPVVAEEREVLAANALARATTAIDADETGTAGLAGLVTLHAEDPIASDENVAVIFSGKRR